MKKTLLLSSAVVLAVSAITANAAPAMTGIYAGGNLGYAWVQTPDAIAPFSQDDNNLLWGLNVGGNFAINPNLMFGLQGGYTSYGNTKYNFDNFSAKLSTSAWDLLATGTYVFDNGINLFAKAGVAYESLSIDEPGVNDNSQVRPEVAVGAGYMWNNLNFTVEYRHIFASDLKAISENDSNSVPTVNALMAGVSYQFNI